MIEEGNAKINIKEGIFYNPHMELCRDLSSLVVSTLPDQLPDQLRVCDGMSATGVRGLRYVLENKNVENITFVDMEEDAVNLTKENLKLNNLNFPVIKSDINHFLYTGGEKFNFVEIDPFGSPVPFIRSALFNLRASRTGFLSVTATDTAVLCGIQKKACRINYCANPLHNFFCHETGARILIGHIARVAAPLKLGIIPIFTFSKRHYFKIILKVEKSAEKAYRSIENLGFVSWCPNCFSIKTNPGPFLSKDCKCGSRIRWGGPLWLDKIFDNEIIEGMEVNNKNRNYKNKAKIYRILNIISEEADMPPFYYDLHKIFDKLQITPRKMDEIMENLTKKDYKASRTHFNNKAIKTNADSSIIFDILKDNI